MPAISRVGVDLHVGHASPTPSPFHQTAYASGSPNVNVNGAAAVRIGDASRTNARGARQGFARKVRRRAPRAGAVARAARGQVRGDARKNGRGGH